MKITTLSDGAVRVASDPDDNGVTPALRSPRLLKPGRKQGASVIQALRRELTSGNIDLAHYTIYHVDLARALLSPLGRQLWPASHRNAAAYPVVDSAGCDCRTCQAIREEQGRDPLDTCVPQARYTLAAALAEAIQRAEADGRQRCVIQVDPRYVQGGVLRYAVCAADDLPDDADVVAAT